MLFHLRKIGKQGHDVWKRPNRAKHLGEGKTKWKRSCKEQHQFCFLFNSSNSFLQAPGFIDSPMYFTSCSVFNNISTRQFYSLCKTVLFSSWVYFWQIYVLLGQNNSGFMLSFPLWKPMIVQWLMQLVLIHKRLFKWVQNKGIYSILTKTKITHVLSSGMELLNGWTYLLLPTHYMKTWKFKREL